jgi:hypothetical protein
MNMIKNTKSYILNFPDTYFKLKSGKDGILIVIVHNMHIATHKTENSVILPIVQNMLLEPKFESINRKYKKWILELTEFVERRRK